MKNEIDDRMFKVNFGNQWRQRNTLLKLKDRIRVENVNGLEIVYHRHLRSVVGGNELTISRFGREYLAMTDKLFVLFNLD